MSLTDTQDGRLVAERLIDRLVEAAREHGELQVMVERRPDAGPPRDVWVERREKASARVGGVLESLLIVLGMDPRDEAPF